MAETDPVVRHFIDLPYQRRMLDSSRSDLEIDAFEKW